MMKRNLELYILTILLLFFSKIHAQVQFEPNTILDNIFFADAPNSVFAVDLDQDGDIDLLSSSSVDTKLAWYKNDGEENFTDHIIAHDLDKARSVYSVDIDNDGDIDILSTSHNSDYVEWHENNGGGNFLSYTTTRNVESLYSVYAIDIDSDGDIDVLSASATDSKIAWYKNLLITYLDNITNNFSDKYYLYNSYPNQFNPTTTIEYSMPEEGFVKIKVFDILGAEVATLIDKQQFAGKYNVEFNASNLPSGLYIYRMNANNYSISRKMLLIK